MLHNTTYRSVKYYNDIDIAAGQAVDASDGLQATGDLAVHRGVRDRNIFNYRSIDHGSTRVEPSQAKPNQADLMVHGVAVDGPSRGRLEFRVVQLVPRRKHRAAPSTYIHTVHGTCRKWIGVRVAPHPCEMGCESEMGMG